MSDRVKRKMHVSGGNAGTQGDFLDECWESASPGHSGTQGTAGPHGGGSRSRVDARSRDDRDRNSAEMSGQNVEHSRVPDLNTQHQDTNGTWDADARKVIEALPDVAVRPVLQEYFNQTVVDLQRDRGFTRHDAEQQAFGLLLFQILKCGIDVTAPPATPCGPLAP